MAEAEIITFTHKSFPPKGLVFPSQKLSWDVHLDLPVAHDG